MEPRTQKSNTFASVKRRVRLLSKEQMAEKPRSAPFGRYECCMCGVCIGCSPAMQPPCHPSIAVVAWARPPISTEHSTLLQRAPPPKVGARFFAAVVNFIRISRMRAPVLQWRCTQWHNRHCFRNRWPSPKMGVDVNTDSGSGHNVGCDRRGERYNPPRTMRGIRYDARHKHSTTGQRDGTPFVSPGLTS